jgi:protein-S-isoprenylcysteine O-methyltransferase Ste14
MPGNPLTDPNWAPDLADQITGFIGNVRDKTTNNAIKAARGIVFGLLAAILGVVVLVLALVFATRGLQSLLDLLTSWERAVYISYFIVGGIFTLAGLFLMGKRATR